MIKTKTGKGLLFDCYAKYNYWKFIFGIIGYMVDLNSNGIYAVES